MTSTRLKLLRPVAVVFAFALAALVTPPPLATAADQVAFSIDDARVTESSGLARDVDAKLYWTVNDSGAEGTVYGVTRQGDVKGILGFRAQPTDVEAVAMHDRRLYVADIGDNGRARDMISVYYFDDPQANNRTVPYRSYDFSYPDGPHDAETLLVDQQGRLYVVTKELRGGIYVAPKLPSRQGVNRLRRVGDAPAFVTDGVFLPGDRGIALRTYVSLTVLDDETYEPVARDGIPWQRQGESIAVTLDGRSLLLGSEGKKSSVLQVGIPATLGAAPSAGSKAPVSPQPTPTSTEGDSTGEDNPGDDQGASTNRTGTLLALALAALVALVAGVVVAARRR